MNIKEFGLKLQKLYEEMSSTFSSYQSSTGLNCLSGCGRCCLNPEVEATVMEMIPMALKIMDEGKLEEWLLRLETTEKNHCLVYVETGPNGQGKCGDYTVRPSICRMFGVAGYFDKYHDITLSICKLIKEAQPELTESVLAADKSAAPMMAVWSTKLGNLDSQLILGKIPINQALKGALERVGFYAQMLQH